MNECCNFIFPNSHLLCRSYNFIYDNVLCVCVCGSGVLDSGGPDFEDGEEVFDAIGGVLQEVSADCKNEDDIRDICLQMFNTLKL